MDSQASYYQSTGHSSSFEKEIHGKALQSQIHQTFSGPHTLIALITLSKPQKHQIPIQTQTSRIDGKHLSQ